MTADGHCSTKCACKHACSAEELCCTRVHTLSAVPRMIAMRPAACLLAASTAPGGGGEVLSAAQAVETARLACESASCATGVMSTHAVTAMLSAPAPPCTHACTGVVTSVRSENMFAEYWLVAGMVPDRTAGGMCPCCSLGTCLLDRWLLHIATRRSHLQIYSFATMPASTLAIGAAAFLAGCDCALNSSWLVLHIKTQCHKQLVTACMYTGM